MPPNYLLACRMDWQAIPPDSYVHQITALRHCAGLEFSQPITLFAGENGSGKSTLLTAMAVAFGLPGSGGTQNYVSGQEEAVLAKAMRLIKGSQRPPCSYFFRADQFAALGEAAEAYQSNYGLRPLRQQSHGEGVLAFLQSFQGKGLFFLDEPEAALSPQRQLTLVLQIMEMAAAGAQFFIASHSPILLGLPQAQIYGFSQETIAPCAYTETESYQVMELFLNHREALLRRLLQKDQ